MKTPRARAAILLSIAIAVLLWGYLLFHGYLDDSHFETMQIERSSSKHVAMLVKRWDDQALGGLTYLVVIDDHPLSPRELRHAYYSDAVVFDAMSDVLSLQWNGPNELIVTCGGTFLEQQYINKEKHQSGDVTVVYRNISPDTARTYRPK